MLIEPSFLKPLGFLRVFLSCPCCGLFDVLSSFSRHVSKHRHFHFQNLYQDSRKLGFVDCTGVPSQLSLGNFQGSFSLSTTIVVIFMSLIIIFRFFNSHGVRTGIFEASKLVLVNVAPTLPDIQVAVAFFIFWHLVVPKLSY